MRDNETVSIDRLKKLVKRLRIKASKERRRIGSDLSHFEGMSKGLWLAYEESAKEILKLI